MRRNTKWSPEKESDLADAFIPWIETSGWDVFQEVSFKETGRVADIILRRYPTVWAIELKTSLSLDLLVQAEEWIRYTNYVSIVVPDRKSLHRTRSYRFVMKVLKDYGIGLFTIGKGFDDSFLVTEVISPTFRRFNPSKYWSFLHDGYKVSGKAGNNNGDRWTAFRQTCWNLWNFLEINPGSTMDQIVTGTTHHYRTSSTARQCIMKWINSGIIEGVQIDSSTKPFKFYLKDGFDWKTKAKYIT